MADAVSALAHGLVAGHHGAHLAAGVTLVEVTGFSLHQLAAWPETFDAVGATAAATVAAAAAPGPGRATEGSGGTLMRVQPLVWWLLAPGPDAVALPALAPETGSVLDLSDTRVWLRASGPQAATLLNGFLPLDLRPASFGPGSVASSAIHHVGVTLWRDAIDFNLFLPRSFAATLWDLLFESALQYGLDVQRSSLMPD